MGLFQNKPDTTDQIPLYTLGANKTLLIIGLGNPGKEYKGTRHNIGFEILNEFAAKNEFPGWLGKRDIKAEVSVSNLGESRIVLCKPSTFMNDSGQAAQAVQRFYRVYNQNTLVVYDELAIPFGQLRTRLGGSDAGHNGVKSLIEHLGDDFGRLRIGVGSEVSKKADATNFVLGKFTKPEQRLLPQVIKESNAMVTEYIFGGSLPHDTRTVL